ncbi:GntR family transcriptional regulator [Pyrinomonas methylaliphatogenes]|uniref:Transcriptional regulator n=1 Tax=Pyrinomonas methylaliphatogenes TaxID=454194 RepID=A0A0B6WWG8_9BACT|nr:GntR family transcriptional regulator [Pyrinomonas methylaliphatogenes]MBX5478887.1 GntR family transcriptional regulator [Pyrinomonas methylaliphatogenes]CDM64599.1 transcriptional regulator [Pyrinomonas methylaliphatogenes]
MEKALDRNSYIPLYAQIQQKLRQMIERGEIAPGAPVPSERELAERYGVSRMTARQALRALRHDGLVYRERGIGTFVARRKVDVHTRNLVGFTEDMRQRGLKPSSKLILLKREKATQQIANELGIEVGEGVFHLERLRLANGTPMAYESNYIPADLCPDLDQYDLERDSLYRILEEEHGIRMQSADEVLEAARAPRREARYLSIRAGSPVLVVHRVVYGDNGRAIESVRTIYRADRYRATFHLTKNTL